MSFESQRLEIIDKAKELLEAGTVKSMIAYAQGEIEGTTIPRYFKKIEDLKDLKWDKECTPNIAKYLLDKKESIAIAAKPCDARAIAMYLVERQINREKVHIIGLECEGMVGKEGKPRVECSECSVRIPPVYDTLIKNPKVQDIKQESENKENTVEDLEYNLDRFENEMKKCIMCFSCRQACYGCYCNTCFIERGIPNWLPAEINMGAKMTFHLGRAMHLAGRCIECGACERVCPSGVNIRYLIKEITEMCKDLYGYTAGMDIDEIPALSDFRSGDKEVGFLGGEDGEACNHS
jgi:formate dehydrogenase (coenzyme F420) beta subunit